MKYILFTSYIIFMIFSSCTHPTPSLSLIKTKDSTIVEVKYKNPQMYFYDEAFNHEKCAFILGINHSNSIPVPIPPFSTMVNNKWYYYLYIFDTLTIGKKISHVYTDQIKIGESNLDGQITRVFPTQEGFVAVYSKQNKIVFSEFDLNGKVVTDKEVLFSDPGLDISNSTILSVSCKNDCLWVFLMNELNYNYKGTWNIHLIKRDIHQKKSEIFYNYIQSDSGWNNAKNFNVEFVNDTIAISWLDGYRQEQDKQKMNARLYLASCSLKDIECKNKTVIREDMDYNSAKTIFYTIKNQTYLLLSENDSLWKYNIEINDKLNLVSEVEKKDLMPLFWPDADKRFKLEMTF